MTTTDTDALRDRIAIALAVRGQDFAYRVGPIEARALTAAVLPIVAVEVRKAKAEAWQEGVNFALPGKETYWISKHNPHRATETGGSDEHR